MYNRIREHKRGQRKMNCVFCNCGKEEVAFDVEKPKCGIRNFKVSLVEY